MEYLLKYSQYEVVFSPEDLKHVNLTATEQKRIQKTKNECFVTSF